MNNAPWQMGAVQLGNAIAAGELSAEEVMDSHLARIAEVNPIVNAVTQTLEAAARETARAVDHRRNSGEVLGRLAGVPFSIKECIDVAGSATTFGISALKGAVPPRDAPIVRRLRDAGAIPIARTNLPDLSMRFHTTSQLYGETRNPWSAACSPGGSSGGEGVALATGMSPLGLGSDAGGSVRIPALFGGVTALKPTYGRLPSDRSIGPRDLTLASQLVPVEGIFARTVADLECAFQLIAGPDPCDPRVVPAPVEGPGGSAPTRVAVILDPGNGGVHPQVRSAVEGAADILEKAGYTPELAEVPRFAEALEVYGKLIMTEFSLAWPTLQRILAPDARRYIEFSMEACQPVGLSEYVRLTSVHHGIRRDWSLFFERYPLMLAPVFTEVSVPPAFDIVGRAEHERVGHAMRMCTVSSLAGAPAVAVPTGLNGGLPLGVQLIGRFYREDYCLSAAAVIERKFGLVSPINPVGRKES